MKLHKNCFEYDSTPQRVMLIKERYKNVFTNYNKYNLIVK